LYTIPTYLRVPDPDGKQIAMREIFKLKSHSLRFRFKDDPASVGVDVGDHDDDSCFLAP
jgi:hypothetical protein